MARLVLLAAALLLAPALAAQPAPGAVEGHAHRDEDGAPLPFALVRLFPTRPQGADTQQVATGVDGRFRFARVPAGEYRLQLARIGYRPVLTPALVVADGAVVRQELRGAAQAVRLAAVTVRGEPGCLTGDRLAEEPAVASLWDEARTGVELRRAFERQYRFVRTRRQDVRLRRRLMADAREVRVDTTVSEPDSVQARDAREQAEHRAQGYARGNTLVLPNEKELLDADFLRDHCVETAIAREEGELGLRFRPVRTRREGVGIRGTVWVDATTYAMRRLDVEHLDGGVPYGRTHVAYADVPVDGTALRLPAGGRAAIKPRGAASLVSGADVVFTIRYDDFAPVRAR